MTLVRAYMHAASSLKPRKKITTDLLNASARAFIDSIESSWKGHEVFAMWLTQQLQPKTIVDLGFDRGLSTLAFAYQSQAEVYGIDWFEDGNYASKSFALDSAFRNIANAIRFNYMKNIHLVIGPFRDVCKTWKRPIDILHIDWAHTYKAVYQHHENWSRFLKPNGLLLIHDVEAFPSEVGRFFRGLPHFKLLFPEAHGLGIATYNERLIQKIISCFGDRVQPV